MPALLSASRPTEDTISGAKVISVVPARGRVSSSISVGSARRKTVASWAPLRVGLRNGPSRWIPSTPGTPSSMAAWLAAMAANIVWRSALMSVGRKPVVPNCRCAAPMRRTVSTSGASLKSTPPPPLTCRSINPGASNAPPRSRAADVPARPATTSTTRPPSRITEWSASMLVPSNTRALVRMLAGIAACA